MPISLMLFALQAAEPVPAPPPATPSAAMAAALANRPRMAKPPQLKIEPDYVRPNAALQAGEYGEVSLRIIVGEDGRVSEPTVVVSSRSALIDAAAMAATAGMRFTPAQDAAGTPIALPIRVSVEFPNITRAGIATYRCDQFARDVDWWQRTWPADKRDRIRDTMAGLVVVYDLRNGKMSNFRNEWLAAAEACRAEPRAFMLDKLELHGKLLRGALK
jgi:TonB family protein